MVGDDDWFPLAELAERLAQLIWVERRVADLLRGWSRVESDTDAALGLRIAAEHHEWHSDVLGKCLPTSPQLTATIAAPTPGWQHAVQVLGQLTQPDQTTARLNVVVRELDPWLDRECLTLQTLLRPIADAALLRWLRFVVDDHERDAGPLQARLGELQQNTIRLDDRAVLDQLDLRGRSTAPESRG